MFYTIKKKDTLKRTKTTSILYICKIITKTKNRNMIHEVKIKNCLSFKDEQILSFEATSDKTHDDLYCVKIKPSLRLLKLGIIYGANASGKTNFLVALNFLRDVVLEAKEDKFEEIDFQPFLLDKDTPKENGELYISFYIEKTRYIYSLILNAEHIVDEKLIFYPSTQPATLFHRQYDSENDISIIDFGGKLDLSPKEKIILEGNTIKNSSVLSIYNKSNVTVNFLESVVSWFKTNFMEIIKPKTRLTSWTSNKLEKSDKCKDFVVEILQEADFNISDIIIDEKERDIDEELAELIKDDKRIPNNKKEALLKDRKLKLKSISFQHTTSKGSFKIPFSLQSSGTTRYYGLGGVLNSLLQEEKFLTIDELETSLHYELVNHFIKTFLVNTCNSQLLFTTHNINILMEEFIRRDVLWFCEKQEDGATELYSASDFKLHKNTSIFNAYRIGKLGAKPNLGNIYLEQHG